ncbi:hypothetical protein PZH31_14680, partial [[Ruminococcus] torques]|nr:hypothetical protein [[Ruminococcus] torques]
IFGKKAEKKQAEQQEQMAAAAQKKGIGDRYRSCFIFAGILNKHAGKDEIKGGDAFVFTAE